MPLDIQDWNTLLQRIETGSCTPFLGAGACYGLLPTGTQLAEAMIAKYEYPFDTRRDDLTYVAQYAVVNTDGVAPKEFIVREYFRDIDYAEKIIPTIPHAVLAALPLPLYITTNYDDFMYQALVKAGKKPRREICRWSRDIKDRLADEPSVFDDSEYHPTPDEPLVFHLHGYLSLPESLVLTEDDYIEFLVTLSSDRGVLPPAIQHALARNSLLFIGYRLIDINFRVLFQSVTKLVNTTSRRQGFTLQYPRPEHEYEAQYLEKYFSKNQIKVVWGSADEFSRALNKQWEDFSDGS